MTSSYTSHTSLAPNLALSALLFISLWTIWHFLPDDYTAFTTPLIWRLFFSFRSTSISFFLSLIWEQKLSYFLFYTYSLGELIPFYKGDSYISVSSSDIFPRPQDHCWLSIWLTHQLIFSQGKYYLFFHSPPREEGYQCGSHSRAIPSFPCPKSRNAPEWSKENFFLLPKCISNCHINQFSFLRFKDRFVGDSGEILSYSSRRTFRSDYLFFFLLLFLRIYSCMDVTSGKEVIMLTSLWEWIQHVDECWVNDSRGNGVKETGLSSSERVHFLWYPAMESILFLVV